MFTVNSITAIQSFSSERDEKLTINWLSGDVHFRDSRERQVNENVQ